MSCLILLWANILMDSYHFTLCELLMQFITFICVLWSSAIEEKFLFVLQNNHGKNFFAKYSFRSQSVTIKATLSFAIHTLLFFFVYVKSVKSEILIIHSNEENKKAFMTQKSSEIYISYEACRRTWKMNFHG